MPGDAALARYVQLMTDSQSRLYAFIYSLLSDAELARDVLQETNAVLWAKAAEFEADRDFGPWALAIARYQVLAARQRMSRDRLVFDPDVLDRIARR